MATDHETISTLEATPVKFGPGACQDAGWELKRLGVKRALLLTDPGVAALGHPERIKKLIEADGIDVVVYDHSRVEPTSDCLQHACDFAHEHEVDGFVSVGDGTSRETAKVANLIVSHPAPGQDGYPAPSKARTAARRAAPAHAGRRRPAWHRRVRVRGGRRARTRRGPPKQQRLLIIEPRADGLRHVINRP